MLAAWYLVLFSVLFLRAAEAPAAIDNTARAVGVYNTGPVISAPSNASIPVIPAAPQITIDKSGVLNDDDGTPGLSAGDTISYTVEVSNPGNVSLTGIILTDPLIPLVYVSGDADFDTEIDPGETWTYTGSYTVTVIDLATNGGGDFDIDNTATVTSNEIGPVADTAEVIIDPNIAMAVTKTGILNDDDGNPGLTAGDTIDYQIDVENTGTVELNNVVVADTLAQGAMSTNLTPVYDSGDVNADTRINAGETWVYRVSYVLTQADLDDGGDLVNTASVTTTEIGPRNAVHTLPLAGLVESYTMTKLASLADSDGDGFGDVGEVITYTFRFTNTGNRTLANLLATDPLPGLSAIACANDADTDGDIDLLAPGQTLDCTATYTVQVSDILPGVVINTATSSATRANGLVPVTEDDSANDNSTTTGTDNGFGLDVEKLVSSAVEVLPNVVEIEYSITVTNPNAITMTGVRASEDLAAAITAPAEMIATPEIMFVAGFTGTGGAHPGFDGETDTQLLAGAVELAPGATGEIRLKVLVDRKSQALETLNTVQIITDQLPGGIASDDPGVTPGNPDDVNPTPYVLPDLDNDGAPDGNEPGSADRDGDGINNTNDYDPTGYFYCEEDGRILTGGLVSVRNVTAGITQTGVGSSGNITIVTDGSSGFYQFYVTAPGTYRLVLNLPGEGVASTNRPSGGTLDVTSLLPANPGVLGSGESGSSGVLADYSAAANPYYTEFVFEDGDPVLFNNNIPLALCGPAEVTASKQVTAGPTVQPSGESNVVYRVAAENTGTIRIDNVSLRDDLDAVFGAGNYAVNGVSIETAPASFGASVDPFFDGASNTNLLVTGGSLAPGESVSVLLDVDVTAAPDTYLNTVVAGADHPVSGLPIEESQASAEVVIVGSVTGGIVASKMTPFDAAPLGAQVPYTLVFKNTNDFVVRGVEMIDRLPRGFSYVAGTAEVDGVAREPVYRQPELIWANTDFAAGQEITVTLMVLVGAGVTGTEFTNYAYVRNPVNGLIISNRAQATLRLEIEPVFQCSTVIGRVFDDLDHDGYHDPGEPGLGGVRLATATGELITTDEFGRYHIACSDVPDDRIGSNYILKLDHRTLPSGYAVTSENPRVVRLTRGKLVKLNFAAANLRRVVLALQPDSFEDNSTRLTPKAISNVARILPILEDEQSILVLFYDGNDALKGERLESVRALVEKAWAARSRPGKLRIEIGKPSG